MLSLERRYGPMLASVYVTAEAFGTQATLPCWGWSTTTSTSCVRRRLTLRVPSAKSSSESTLMAADRFTGRSRSLAAGMAGPSSTTALSAVTSSKPAAYSWVMTLLDRFLWEWLIASMMSYKCML